MKKIIAFALCLALFMSLCACSASEQQTDGSVAQNKPAAGKSQNNASNEAVKTPEPTEEPSIWATEFQEKNCKTDTIIAPAGEKLTSYFNKYGGPELRRITEYPDGTVTDEYYYSSTFVSKSITTTPDGTYEEYHYLDNGYMENYMRYTGTLVYGKIVGADGYYQEIKRDENGDPVSEVFRYPDGSYSESYYYDTHKIEIYGNTNTGERSESEYYENGVVKKSIWNNAQTGAYSEYENYENGTMKKSAYKDPAAESYTEQEFFESGKIKYSKNQMPDFTCEERYDEEGYHTYFYSKSADEELECICDETGKLIKVIQNGEVKEDEAALAQYASSYNFRG